MFDLYKSVNILGFFIILQIILGILTINIWCTDLYCIYAPNKFYFFS